MARKPLPKKVPPTAAPAPGKNLDVVQLSYAAGAADTAQRNEALCELLISLGQARMAYANEEFSRIVRISGLARIKESKIYKHLRGTTFPGHPEILDGTWEDYVRCATNGKRSVDQVDEDIKNLRAFGDQTFDALADAGIGYRELRQLRQLPEDDKAALAELAIKGSKDQVLELAEDLLARGERQRKALEKERDKAVADYDSREKVIQQNKDQIHRLQEQVARIPRETPDEKARAMLSEAMEAIQDCLVPLRHLSKCTLALLQHLSANEIDPQEWQQALDHHASVFACEVGALLNTLELGGAKKPADDMRAVLR